MASKSWAGLGLPYLYKEGTLNKRQRAQHHKNNAKLKFQERYFQLKGDSLDYYDPKKKLSAAAKGAFSMRRAKIVEPVPYGIFKKSNMFQIGDNTEIVYMVATSEFERDSWLKALRQCCVDCGNEMFTKFHPGAYGVTAKNHWSCCGASREGNGCSMCYQPPKATSDETDAPKKTMPPERKPSKPEPPDKPINSTLITPKEVPTPEPQVMYINPLTENPATETTKIPDPETRNKIKRQSAISTDSGNGTGSTNSSRPHSQIIDPHAAPSSSSDSPQIKPPPSDSHILSQVPEKIHEVTSANETESEDSVKATMLQSCSDSTKESFTDKTDKATVDTVTNKVAETVKSNSDDSTVNKVVDNTRANDVIALYINSNTADGDAYDSDTVPLNPITRSTPTDTISDISETKVTDKAWQDSSSKPTTPVSRTGIDNGQSKSAKSSVDKIDFKRGFEEVDDNDDVFVTELPNYLRRPSQFAPMSPMSPNLSPGLSLGRCSPINMSPHTRRSSFSVTKAVIKSKHFNAARTNKDGFTQLHLACKNGDTGAIQSEIEMGADVDMGTTGNTSLKPIFLAFLHDHYQALEYLLVHCNANPDSTESSNGASLLQWASQHGNLSVVQMLLQNGAAVDKLDWKGNTSLFEACKNGHLDVVDVLIKHGADVNKMGVSKRTPLHEAAQFGHYEVTRLLLDHNATPDVRESIDNNTPAELASLHKHQKVYNLLVPSPEEDGAPYQRLHVIENAYPEGIVGVSFCNGNVLVTGSKEDHLVGFWDVSEAKCRRTVHLDNTILSIATHGNFVAVGSTTIHLVLSSMETWRRSVVDKDEDYEAIEEDLPLHVVGFTPNGRLVTADVEDEDALVKLWPVLSENLHLRTCQKSFSAAVDGKSTTYTMAVCPVPDSAVLAVVVQPGSLFNPKGNKVIRIFDWKTCKCLQTINTGAGGFDTEVVMTFSTAKANELAVACQGSIKIYNTDTAQVIAGFSSTKGARVTSLAYSTNGRQLCAGLESGCIQVFNLSSKAQQFALETQTSSICCMGFSPDGHFLAVGTSDGNLEIWQTNPLKT